MFVATTRSTGILSHSYGAGIALNSGILIG